MHLRFVMRSQTGGLSPHPSTAEPVLYVRLVLHSYSLHSYARPTGGHEKGRICYQIRPWGKIKGG